jgi:hypothetical protein
MLVDRCVHTAVYKRKQRLAIKSRLIANQPCRSGYTQPTHLIPRLSPCVLPYLIIAVSN